MTCTCWSNFERFLNIDLSDGASRRLHLSIHASMLSCVDDDDFDLSIGHSKLMVDPRYTHSQCGGFPGDSAAQPPFHVVQNLERYTF